MEGDWAADKGRFLMFWLGLVLPICYLAGYTGASIPTQWAVLSVGLLPAVWRAGEVTTAHWLGLGFVVFAVLSVFWTLDISIGLWIAIIWGLAFWWGSTAGDLLPLWRGLAFGLAVNGLVAGAQWAGYRPVEAEGLAGLLFNTTYLGAAAALVAVALICRDQWWHLAMVVPALGISQSRGGFIVAVVALVAKYAHWSVALGLVAAGAVVIAMAGGESDLMRLHFWMVALKNLELLGNGVDSFNVVHVLYHGKVIRAENVHNDYIQLIFLYGIAGIIPLVILGAALWRRHAVDWPVLVGFATMALFYFPFWCPIPAFLGCAVAGSILRGHDPLRWVLGDGRSGVLSRGGDEKRGFGLARGGDIPAFEHLAENGICQPMSRSETP